MSFIQNNSSQAIVLICYDYAGRYLQQLLLVNTRQNYNMSTLNQQFQSIKQAVQQRQRRSSETHKIRTDDKIIWKKLMLRALHDLIKNQQYDSSLLEQLRTLVSHIPNDKFIQAIINLEPYRPDLELQLYKKSTRTSKLYLSPKKQGEEQVTTTSGSIHKILKQIELDEFSTARKLKSKQKSMAMFIKEEVLAREMASSNHPFTKIIDGYALILQNKYKNLLDRLNLLTMDQFKAQLTLEFQLLTQFFRMVSDPIIDIFQLKEEERETFADKIQAGMVKFLRNNQNFCLSLTKIIRYYVTNSIQIKQFQERCPIHAQVQTFEIPQKYQIQGCYIYTTAQIICFTQTFKGRAALDVLASIRDSISKDIDNYYTSNQQKMMEMQVNSAMQLQILKFCMVKLRIFSTEILAGLILLSILYGQDQIAYLYDQSSYIHSQLSIAFQAIQKEL